MMRMARPRRIEHGTRSENDESTERITGDDTSIWPELPVPTNPREQRKIKNHLIVFAIAGLVGLLLAFLTH